MFGQDIILLGIPCLFYRPKPSFQDNAISNINYNYYQIVTSSKTTSTATFGCGLTSLFLEITQVTQDHLKMHFLAPIQQRQSIEWIMKQSPLSPYVLTTAISQGEPGLEGFIEANDDGNGGDNWS